MSVNSGKKMEFVPHCSGKHQSNAHSQVKDHVILHIQKNFKNGADMAAVLKDEMLKDPVSLPTRKTVTTPETDALTN